MHDHVTIILFDFTDHAVILFPNLPLKLIPGYATSLTHTLSRFPSLSTQHTSQHDEPSSVAWAWRALHVLFWVRSICFCLLWHGSSPVLAPVLWLVSYPTVSRCSVLICVLISLCMYTGTLSLCKISLCIHVCFFSSFWVVCFLESSLCFVPCHGHGV